MLCSSFPAFALFSGVIGLKELTGCGGLLGLSVLIDAESACRQRQVHALTQTNAMRYRLRDLREWHLGWKK